MQLWSSEIMIPDPQTPNKSGTFETIEEYQVALELVRKAIGVFRAHQKHFELEYEKEHGHKHCGDGFLMSVYAMDLEYAIRPPKQIENTKQK